MGIPISHYFLHIFHRVLSCWAIPGHCSSPSRADLAWSSGCYCVDHNPTPCQPGTGASAVSFPEFSLGSPELMDGSYNTWKMSRYAFFTMTFCISFCWYWFPDFIFPALSYFSFPCWIKPESEVVNQIFGMRSGMGLLPITFDCE